MVLLPMNLDFDFDEAAHDLLLLSVRDKEWLFSLKKYYALKMCLGGLYCLENYKNYCCKNDNNTFINEEDAEKDIKNLLKYSRSNSGQLIDKLLTSKCFSISEEKYMGFLKHKRVYLTQEGINKRISLSHMANEEIKSACFSNSLAVIISALSIYSCLYRRMPTRPGKKDMKEFMIKIKTFYPFLYKVCRRIRMILSSSY